MPTTTPTSDAAFPSLGTAMIPNAHDIQLAAVMQIFVHRIAPGEQRPGDQYLIADFEGADFLFGERKGKVRHII